MTAASAAMLDAGIRPALIDLLYRLADDCLIMGHRDSEWTGLGPILEEDIAFASMAQDKIGHALAFYNLLHELGEPEPDRLAFLREAGEFRCCSLVTLEVFAETDAGPAPLCNNPVRDRLVSRGNWGESLIRQFLFSEADALRMAALESSSYEPLAKLARKLRGELKYHTLHGRTLVRRLAGAPGEGRQRLQSGLDRLFGHALGMFEPTTHEAVLAGASITPAEAELESRWRETVGPLLAEAGLRVPEARAVYGGRAGRHPPELARLVENMQKVFRMDPNTQW